MLKDSRLSEYAKEAGKLNIQMVNVLDKKEVNDYLTGLSDQCAQVDASRRA
jgi:NADP-dependent 3-hydroxy acid dehydrogenase YdfG